MKTRIEIKMQMTKQDDNENSVEEVPLLSVAKNMNVIRENRQKLNAQTKRRRMKEIENKNPLRIMLKANDR